MLLYGESACISTCMTKFVAEVNRVVLDVTSKPRQSSSGSSEQVFYITKYMPDDGVRLQSKSCPAAYIQVNVGAD